MPDLASNQPSPSERPPAEAVARSRWRNLPFPAAWIRFTGDTLALLLFLQMPIGSLFQLSSWMMIMRPLEIAREMAMIVCIYATCAALLGLAVAAGTLLLRLLSRRLSDWWEALCLTAAMTVILFTLVPVGFAWWKGLTVHLRPMLGHVVPPRSFVFILLFIVAAALVQFWRKGWVASLRGMSESLAPTRRLALMIVGFCFALVLLSGMGRFRPFGWHAAEKPMVAKAGSPNIILISVDTLAAKDMSLYGYRLPTTPNIEAFAKSAYVFDHYYANSNYTIPTITSIQTGRYPTTHGVTQLRARLPPGDGERTLGRVLQQAGYVTASIVANDGAHPMYLNFSDAYDFQAEPIDDAPGGVAQVALTLIRSRVYHWINDWWVSPYSHVIYPLLDFDRLQTHNWYPAEPVVDTAGQVAHASGKPLFLWTHFMAPHEPYLPPAPFLGKFLPPGDLDRYNAQVDASRNAVGPYRPEDQGVVDRLRMRYDEYVAYADHGVQQLLDRLQAEGVLDNAVVILTADHGQSFEKGWHGHRGPMLHDALIRIPLVVRLPGQTQGARIASNAEEVDLLPTVLDLVGLPTPDWAEGESLRPAIEHGVSSTKPKFAFDLERESRFVKPRQGNFAVIEGHEKFVHHQVSGCEELYDLQADPEEMHNRVDAAAPERLRLLRGLLEAKVGVALQPQACTAGKRVGQGG